MCQCGHCGKKKWSNRRKKANKVLPLIAINVCIWFVNTDALTEKKTLVFENPKITAVEAIRSLSESTEDSQTTESHDDPTMVKAPKTSASSMSKTSPVIRAADVEAIKQVAEKEGVDWKVLGAVFVKETQGDCKREGDTDFIKPSWGCYQINKHYHPEVTWEQATDLSWSSQWTAKRLKAKAEKHGWDNAIAMHNGNPKLPKVQAYLADVKRIMETL